MNRWAKRSVIVLVVTITGPAAAADLPGIAGTGPKAERSRVLRALEAYLSVVDGKDHSAIEKAFHPTGLLMSVSRAGALRFVTQDEWWERVSRIPAGVKPRTSIVRMIDVSGVAAVARVDITGGTGQRTTDYFSLQKVDEGWRIVNKTLSVPLGPPRRPRPSPTDRR